VIQITSHPFLRGIWSSAIKQRAKHSGVVGRRLF
jgi:hypothetical protein